VIRSFIRGQENLRGYFRERLVGNAIRKQTKGGKTEAVAHYLLAHRFTSNTASAIEPALRS
jgi:hypothetical protein